MGTNVYRATDAIERNSHPVNFPRRDKLEKNVSVKLSFSKTHEAAAAADCAK
jgi:hypothetical protein